MWKEANKDIMCPRCNNKVMTYKGGTIPRSTKCKTCNIVVAYFPETDRIETRPVPGLSNGNGRIY